MARTDEQQKLHDEWARKSGLKHEGRAVTRTEARRIAKRACGVAGPLKLASDADKKRVAAEYKRMFGQDMSGKGGKKGGKGRKVAQPTPAQVAADDAGTPRGAHANPYTGPTAHANAQRAANRKSTVVWYATEDGKLHKATPKKVAR